MRAPIAAGVSATAQVNFDWETQPAEGRKPLDTNFIFGVGYTF